MKATWNRREFLKRSSAATLAALAAGAPVAGLLDGCRTRPDLKPSADAVILLWMAG